MFGWWKALRARREQRPFCSALVPAAGSSRRMGGENKLLLPLGGMPVIARTLLALSGSDLVDEIIVAVRQEDLLTMADAARACGMEKPLKIVAGGESRTASVLAALAACDERAEFAAVHDGARPLVTRRVIDETIRRAFSCAAAAPAVPVKDTVKVAGPDRVVVETPPRETLFAVQTPQVFDRALLAAALRSALDDGAALTDDCSAVERLGKEVYLTEGDYENLKITTPEDLVTAEAIWAHREEAAL